MLLKVKKLIKAVKDSTLESALKFQVFLLSLVVATSARAEFDFDALTDEGQTLDDVNEKIEGYSETTFNMIKAAGVLVGLVFVFIGVIRLKKSQDPNAGVSPVQGLALILFGGLCAALPWLLITSSSTVQA